MAEPRIQQTPIEARGAETTGRVRYILLISFILAAVGLGVVAFIFSQMG